MQEYFFFFFLYFDENSKFLSTKKWSVSKRLFLHHKANAKSKSFLMTFAEDKILSEYFLYLVIFVIYEISENF